MKAILALGGLIAAGQLQTSCQNRLFYFGKKPTLEATPTASTGDKSSGQVAIGSSSGQESTNRINPLPEQKTEDVKAMQNAVRKTLQLGKSTTFEVDGITGTLTFVSILEDSRCPTNVVCIWEGQARLSFNVSVPARQINRTVEATLRAGHPELGRVVVDAWAIDLVGLMPDTATNTPNQKVSPEATFSVGKAP
jgi:hypothetical protein